jgi:hypothetical protein
LYASYKRSAIERLDWYGPIYLRSFNRFVEVALGQHFSAGCIDNDPAYARACSRYGNNLRQLRRRTPSGIFGSSYDTVFELVQFA